MAFMNKEKELIEGFKICVLEYGHKEKDYHNPYEIIDIDIDDLIENITPDKVIELANKMIKYANEVKSEYDEYGKLK